MKPLASCAFSALAMFALTKAATATPMTVPSVFESSNSSYTTTITTLATATEPQRNTTYSDSSIRNNQDLNGPGVQTFGIMVGSIVDPGSNATVVESNGDSQGNTTGSAHTSLTYYYEIFSQSSAPILGRIEGNVSVNTIANSPTSQASAVATISIVGNGATILNYTACATETAGVQTLCSPAEGISFDGPYNFLPNTLYTVTQTADARGNAGGVSASSLAEAFVDPLIEIDPVFAAANPDDVLVFSAGFEAGVLPGTDAGPVGAPEPFTVSIFGAGVVGAAAMRRRKAKA